MTKRNVAVTDILGLAASLPTLRVFAAALLLAPLAACAAPLPAEQAAPAVQQPAPAPAPVPVPEATAPAPAAQEPATTPRRPGETTTGRPPAPARPAPSSTPTNTAPVPAPLPADPAPAAEAPAAVPAPIQQPPRAALPNSTASPAAGSLMQTILALALVLAVLAGLAWFLKRFAPKMMGGGNTNLRMVGALNLGGRERIMVVEVGNQWIVVGASPGRINALATMPRQEGVESTATLATATPAGSFSDWLKNTIDKRNAK